MRNLPQTVASQVGNYKPDSQASDESSSYDICASNWPISSNGRCANNHRTNMSPPASGTGLQNYSEPTKLDYLCNYLAEHRVRLLFSFISLAFLALFLLVIYRQFGLVVFASTMVIITVPVVVVLLYARQLKGKEQDKNQSIREIEANQCGYSQRNKSDPELSGSIKSQQGQPIFTTNVELTTPKFSDLSNINENGKQLKRKSPQQKITIQLPPSIVDD